MFNLIVPLNKGKRTRKIHLAKEAVRQVAYKQSMCTIIAKQILHTRHLLHCSPWSLLTATTGIDEGFDLFYDFVYAAINECVPRIRIRGRKYPIWDDNDMISSLKEKDDAHKACSLSLTDYQVFSELRTNFKKLKREKYCDYIYHK